VTFELMTFRLRAERYGTHGTTFVIRYRSTLAQHETRGLPVRTLQRLICLSADGTLSIAPVAPIFFAIAGVRPTSE
jgi:hypothetical protein